MFWCTPPNNIVNIEQIAAISSGEEHCLKNILKFSISSDKQLVVAAAVPDVAAGTCPYCSGRPSSLYIISYARFLSMAINCRAKFSYATPSTRGPEPRPHRTPHSHCYATAPADVRTSRAFVVPPGANVVAFLKTPLSAVLLGLRACLYRFL